MNSVECLTARCLLGIYWLMGLGPLPFRSELLWLLLALLVRCIWLGYYLVMLWIGCSYLMEDGKLSIGYVTGTALFLGYSVLGLLIQVESMAKHRPYVRLEDFRFQLQLQMQRLGMSRGCRRSVRLLLLLGTQVASDISKSWANSQYSISPVYIISLPQNWLLRFRYIQLLWQLMELNQSTLQLRHSLLGLATGNDVWQPYGNGCQDWKQLQTLRKSYDRIYESYEAFGDCYGWGMLGLQMMCGLEFVSNAYWIITEAYISQRLYMIIYNANSCFAMGTLIIALFWYGDASEANFVPLCFWVCWYAVVWPVAIRYFVTVSICQLDCLLLLAMFVSRTVSHFIILVDTFLQRRIYRQLVQHLDVEHLAVANHRQVVLCVAAVLIPFLVVQSVVACSRMNLPNQWYTPLFWFSSPSAWGVQLKLIAFLSDVLVANERVLCMRHSVQLVARSQSTRWQQPPDVQQVIKLKQRYSQLHQMFTQLNLSYGSSLLIIFIVSFFDILLNAFLLAQHSMNRDDDPAYTYHHLGYLLNLLVMLSATCWHCQQSFNHSRQIGCLIPKLVKPLGSKRYNDLVSEFLLQTLHQRFVVTAQHFFSLNLHLLSSMFAAVVTYLVILIQFMFAEKSSQAAAKTQKASVME